MARNLESVIRGLGSSFPGEQPVNAGDRQPELVSHGVRVVAHRNCAPGRDVPVQELVVDPELEKGSRERLSARVVNGEVYKSLLDVANGTRERVTGFVRWRV